MECYQFLLLIKFLLLQAFISNSIAVDISQCHDALGMETGAISDTDVSASSSFEHGNVGPHHARLNQDNHGGAWCPRNLITTEASEWIEIDLHKVHVVTGTGTQGRFGNGQGAEYAEAYILEYWRPVLGKWHRYRNVKGEEVIPGNKNTYLEAKYELDHPIWASKVRFIPYSYHPRTVCMRVELYGCPYNEGILSYSMPQGDKRGNWEFYDTTYDGHWSDELRRGLGQLTDGRKGPDSFKLSHHDSAGGHGWVGWKNDTRQGQPLEIKFEFDQVREFSAIHIYCSNHFTKDIQMFGSVSILFSIGGKYYLGDPIIYDAPEDRVFDYSRNITIKLHRRVGKFVKLRFNFASKWIMISEISFDSDIAHGNFTPEIPTTTEAPPYRERIPINDVTHRVEIPPISTARNDEPTYMAIIIGIMTAVILLLAVAIFIIILRHRQRKSFSSPLATKNGIPPGHHHHLSNESAYGTSEKDPTLMGYRVEDLEERYTGTKLTTLPKDLNDRLLGSMRLDDYQEPFRNVQYREAPHAAYYGYSTVVIDNKDLHDNLDQSDATYDYAVPMPVPSGSSDQDSIFSKSSRGSAKACLQSFFPPPPPPPLTAPPSRGTSNLTYSPASPELVRNVRGSKRRDMTFHRYA